MADDGRAQCTLKCRREQLDNEKYSLITVPIDEAILRPIAPPDNESKLALSAQAHALVPATMNECVNKMKRKSLKCDYITHEHEHK